MPGNVRELRNLLDRANMLADGDEIAVRHLAPFDQRPRAAMADDPTWTRPEIRPLREFERDYLAWARDTFDGERSELATKLGLSERTLYRKLKSLE